VNAQADQDVLFNTNEPLHIAISLSIKAIRNEKYDTVYLKEKLYFDNISGGTDSFDIGVKRRGHFRLQNCNFPPLWIKIDKNKSINTVFQGHKKLKLVMPCDERSSSQEFNFKRIPVLQIVRNNYNRLF
jgi:hypothetical protein